MHRMKAVALAALMGFPDLMPKSGLSVAVQREPLRHDDVQFGRCMRIVIRWKYHPCENLICGTRPSGAR